MQNQDIVFENEFVKKSTLELESRAILGMVHKKHSKAMKVGKAFGCINQV